MSANTRRSELEAFVAGLSTSERERVYGRTQLTSFEECAVFGFENCPVSHGRIAQESSRRAGILCQHFMALTTKELGGECYEYEVECELDEADA